MRRNGQVYVQEYERGPCHHRRQGDRASPPATAPAPRSPSSPTRKSSTTSTFDFDTLEDRLRELAFLNKGLAITLTDERTGKEESLPRRRRRRRVRRVSQPHRGTVHKPIYVDKTVDDVQVEVALQYTTGEEERSAATPTTPTIPSGGTHLIRLPHRPDALTERLRQQGEPVQERHADRRGLPRRPHRRRQRAVPEPQFESQNENRAEQPRGGGHRHQRRQRIPEPSTWRRTRRKPRRS